MKTCRDSKASDKQTAQLHLIFFSFRREAWEWPFSDKPKSNDKSAVLLDPTETRTLLQKLWISREEGSLLKRRGGNMIKQDLIAYCSLPLTWG